MTTRAAALAVLGVTLASVVGCRREGCVGGDDGTCLPPAACQGLRYTCGATESSLHVFPFAPDTTPLPGPKARGAPGDMVLENDLVRVVLAAPSHPSDLGPTGGAILDLAPTAGDSGDQINSIYQAAGLLPRDAVHYDGMPETDRYSGNDPKDAFVAVIFRGHLESDRRVTVVTRYELRLCEPGVRVRTDLYNGAADPNTLYLADGLFWGDNDAAPFTPGAGLGFRAPALDLEDVASAWREWPFVAARAQAPLDTSYAVVPCDHPRLAGFSDPTLTAAGVPLTTTLPGDGLHFERFIIAMPGPDMTTPPGSGVAPAAGEAMRVRAMVHGEAAPVTISGRVVAGGTPINGRSGLAASLLFYEPAFGPDPDDPARRTPWNEVVPGIDGRFTVALPSDRAYRVQPYAFGLPAAAPTSFFVARDGVDIGDITLAASAHLIATITTAPGQPNPVPGTYAELVVVPMAPVAGAAPPSLYGLFAGCNPMLGSPHGGSPACNRAITGNGNFDLLIPPGQYYVYGTRGPFATIDRAPITVAAGDETNVALVVQSLPIVPAGVVSGDFHVHGGASYDSAIPDQDRVVSFLASGIDVIIATDHDVITNYARTLTDLSATSRITIIPGVEQTPNIPWFDVPGRDLPQTLGHFNFWPFDDDPTLPRNGVAPWDELREPGQMMDDVASLFFRPGVRQLNHPFADSKLEREQGFLSAIGYDPRTPIVPGASFAADVLLNRPGAADGRRNIDWDVQEVMNGSSRQSWLRYRAFWFSLLSQEIARAGTANSDSHSLALGQVGYPRNLVFTDPRQGGFDPERFNEDIRRGHMVGTNGPILEVTIKDDGAVYRPGLDPIQVSPDAALVVKVSAAPWIPITKVRVIVNGVAKTLAENPAEFIGTDHLGMTIASKTFDPVLLAPLLNPDPMKPPVDAWLIVEAGTDLPDAVDADGDGLPDLVDPSLPPKGMLADYQAIVPGAWPIAFTNPFLIDVDGSGWHPPGLTP